MAGLQDLKMDLVAHDLAIENYDLQLVEEGPRIQQQLTQRLYTARGEWFLNIQFGVPYFESVWGKQVDRALIEDVIKAEIMLIEDITEITSFTMEIDNVNRTLTVVFRAQTTYGEEDFTIEVT